MSEGRQIEDVVRWIEQHFGGRVTEIARQPRWRELVNIRADVRQAALQNRT